MNAIKSILHEFILPLVLDHPRRLQLQELAVPSLLAPQRMEFEPHRGIFRPRHDQHHRKRHVSSSPLPVSLMCQQRTSRESNSKSPPQKQPTSSTPDYPELTTWLSGLDAHPIHGRDMQNYLQYAAMFMEHGLLRLDDLLGISVEELQGTCAALNLGTACRLIKWASEDSKELQGLPLKIIWRS